MVLWVSQRLSRSFMIWVDRFGGRGGSGVGGVFYASFKEPFGCCSSAGDLLGCKEVMAEFVWMGWHVVFDVVGRGGLEVVPEGWGSGVCLHLSVAH